MVSTIRNSGKAKLLVILLLVFTFSFMLTVQAFAEWVVVNKTYFGTYYSNISTYSHLKVDETRLVMVDYTDSNYSEISGISEDGSLSSVNYAFVFKEVQKYSATEPDHVMRIRNVKIQGETKVQMGGLFGLEIKAITLTPYNAYNIHYTYDR